MDIRQTRAFSDWLEKLRDLQAVARIDLRIRRMSLGNPGDVRPVGGGVSELRVDVGPGYRVYFTRRPDGTVILLCGGDKRRQRADIARARQMAKEVDDGA
ncbi:MAG: type II toxin-antitoxin system RelE/ParE family toxin [Rhodospirillaceae bacterium]|nr:type II toxin-antitoxin system RelE/ParE family toxin [Rhodospirillaceae bacterium]MYB14129.1 type II toxin-antitoxin system RelE/ParE family toxin [Rhodospirillaceae bacterium]MYI49592.1 type II toxin-antitoxin system RelE/ParE family toxin [Rhodospirillaceae bacterium]